MASSTLPWGCCANKDNNDEIKSIHCSKCNRLYHFKCLSLPEISEETEDYYTWKCSNCASYILNSSKKENTPSCNVSTSRAYKRMALNSPPQTTIVTREDVREIIKEAIQEQFASMLEQINFSILKVVNKELVEV